MKKPEHPFANSLLDRVDFFWGECYNGIKFALLVKDSIDDARVKMKMRIEGFAKSLYECHSPEAATLWNGGVFRTGENKLRSKGDRSNV